MASFNDNKRGDGHKRRADDPRRRRQLALMMERLENRRLLSGGNQAPNWHPTDSNLLDAQNGPMANLGPAAVQAYGSYLSYLASGSKGAFTDPLGTNIEFVGSYIGMDVRGYGNFTTFEQSLQSIGVYFTAVTPGAELVEGYVPIAKLPQVAEDAQTVGGEPMFKPTFYQEGASPNQADVALNVAQARTTYSVDGTGQKIGVLSDSANQFTQTTAQGAAVNGTGLAASVASGDLPPNVQVLQDGPAGSSDEGRAMLEQIHDLAPGAALAFATGGGGEASFATNIGALASAGSSVIVDDIGYFDEPYYQDGIVQNAVNQFVNAGGAYVSSVGNQADSGYESQFRATTATVGTLGSGTYMNFNPGTGAAAAEIGINVYTPGTGINLQFDQPYYTTNGVVSNIELDVLSQAGAIVAQANANTIAQQEPYQTTTINLPDGLPAGLYDVVIKVDSGPTPGHVFFYATGDGGFSVDTKYGSAGGTYYPSTHGHNSGAETISTGAVPFWATPAYPHTNPSFDVNEPFSSTGPVLKEFNYDGTLMAVPQLLLKPDVSATDANNTSFFIPGQVSNTTQPNFPANPPYPGDPATSFPNPTTPTNDLAALPNFTGTSAAAPNLAAIVALMKESNPTLTRNEIVENLITTTSSLDGIPAGTWSPQAGYGLVNAVAALGAVQKLKVNSIVPGSNGTVTTIPQFLTVTFNQSVLLATLSPADLPVLGANGATVLVGQPIGVDSATTPSVVEFPITIIAAPGRTGNGTYKDAVGGPIESVNGQFLSAPFFDQFNIQDLNGPRVTETTYFGRIVTLSFNEALNPTTVTPSNIFVFRDGGVNNPNLGPNSILVSNLPGATFSYNPVNFTVTINLTGVAQSSLPTDHYGLIVNTNVTDELNNPLNGAFNGVFPSGTTPGVAGGSAFFQDLGIVTLQAPIVSSLTLAPVSDSGVPGDNNTDITTPSVTGQVTAKFPGTVSGLLVYAEFNGIAHPGVAVGGLDLAVGSGGRGFVGHYDVQATTNALGQFTINYPPGVTPLPDGLNRVRVVVVGAPDIPPLPGLATQQDTSFRVDTSNPLIAAPAAGGPATSIVPGENINSLTSLTLNFADPVNPQGIGNPFAVPATLTVPALNPTTADNVGSYRLFLVNGGALVDESSFITSATFVSTSARVLTSDPYTGQVNLTFAPGLPQGTYDFVALSSAYGTGLSDAAGNPFYGGSLGTANFLLSFNLQPTPTYITSYTAYSPDSASGLGFDTSGVRASYELPVSGVTPRADAPPTAFTVDFSNSLNPALNYTQDVELVRSADSTTALPDGNFGDLGITNTAGFTVVTGTTVTLTNSVLGAVAGQYGYDNRLLITLPAGFTLPADYYRVYLPNSGTQAITDVFGNQLDGEFDGYQNGSGKYVDQLQNGQVRGAGASELADLSGDGVAGGAFMTGFVVVPNGNIIYANAGAIYNPLIPAETPNGSAARPYPVLAPEAVPNAINGGDLNSPVNAGINFDPTYDRSGDGQFEPSAFFAAQQQLQATGGPVVIIAEASVPSRDPSTGSIIQKPYVLEAPNPSGGQAATIANDASAAVPAMTTLVFDQGTILKMQNAALLVQNQGSALQVLGGPNSYQSVIVTSYKDSTVGGVTNGDPNSIPEPGDYGGIVYRNFSQAALPGQATRNDLFPGQIPITGTPSLDDRLKGQFADPTNPDSQVDAISGADDVMSTVDYLTERFAGGTVPQTVGTQYDGITLLDSRPSVVNSTISNSGGAGSAVAGLSVDVDSLRSDDVAQGPLVRDDAFINNALNGIYIRANIANGVAEPSDAVVYPTNPTALGGAANYVLNDPYPYILTSQMEIGRELTLEDGGQVNNTDRLDIIPGMLMKFETGAFLEIGQEDQINRFLTFGATGQGTAASLIVGDPTYMQEYDANNQVNPSSPGFKANSAQLPQVIFTSLNDNAATTSYTNPTTRVTTTIVAPLPALPSIAQTPAPAKGDWGGIQLDAGSRDTINGAVFRYGGGFINTPVGASTLHAIDINPYDNAGAFVSITNNTFLDNGDVPINTSPDAWLATDPQTPLNSGAPFIHGNMFVGNDYNGVGVTGGTTGFNASNDDFNSTWTGGDFTYFLRDTIVLGPQKDPGFGLGGIPDTPSATTLEPTPTPNVTLTLQSTLPQTVLADGSVVPSPGVPLVIKLLNVGTKPPAETNLAAVPAAAIPNSYAEGAGFVVGIDNGIDPPADPGTVIDPGAFSDLRIIGIGANQTTGQSRVPVVITSAYNDTVGTTVNGVQMDQLIPGNTKAPQGGDGGVIYFGGNSLTSYNLTDPRSGSIIDNADISDITRVEQQGGGIVYAFGLTTANAFTPSYDTLFGLPQGGGVDFADQYNAPKSITVSNSNFSNFSSVGFYAHPGYQAILVPVNYTSTLAYVRGSNFNGEPTHTFFYNDTFSDMPTGVYILSQTGADVVPNNGPYPTPAMAVFLNDDFYADGVGIHTFNPAGTGFYAHVALLAMDSIFDANTTSAIVTDGQNYGGTQNEGENNVITIIPGQIIYDDFFGNAANVTGNDTSPGQVSQAFYTDPGFRNAPTGNFFLLPTSSVIDVARSELGPTIFGDMLYPMVNYPQPVGSATVDLNTTPIRNEPTYVLSGNGFLTLDQTKPAGDINFEGGLGYNFAVGGPPGVPYYQDILTLPGRPFSTNTQGSNNVINYPDQWIPVLQSSKTGTTGNAASPGTYAFVPIIGERDLVGDQRVPDYQSGHLGYGSEPYFDLGAYEYIVQNPPVVEAVTATTSTSTAVNIYGVGNIAGVNQLPTSIQFKFNEQLNPATINGMSVIFEASGGDGIFGNGNSPLDRTVSLQGLTSFDNATDTLTISTTSIFPSLATASDEYRIILKGTGSSVIRDNSGLALDGLNLDANGNQLPLPSGPDKFPGSDFVLTFTIDTHPPAIVPGTFKLDPASDTSGGVNITNLPEPTFDGTISDTFPPLNFLQNQTVYIDVSTQGNGVFDLLNAGVGTTNAQGQFKVTLTKPIPNTPNKVGVNGLQEGPGSTITLVRVRVVDQSGNASDQPTDPLSAFVSAGALTAVQEDTVNPKVVAFSPAANTVLSPNPSGQVVFTVTFSKNLKNTTLNANSVIVYRTGGTGSFGAPVQVPIVAGSFTYAYSTNPATLGDETVTFAIAASQPNDEYAFVLKGTGTTPITDLAGNPLDGQGTGKGSDFTSSPFVIFSSSNAHLIYVGADEGTGTGVLGTRENPYPTIAAGMKAAFIGDDVLVLPGTYEEDVQVKAGVRLLSADPSSTDTRFTAGSPTQTLIYGVPFASQASDLGENNTTLFVAGSSVAGIPTEVSGLSIISPLIGDSNLGAIDPTNVAVRTFDSNVTIDRNYIINAGTGIYLSTEGANAATSDVYDNLIAGNLTGILVSDLGATRSTQSPFMIVNNTIADNTTGLANVSTTFGATQAYVINNIFYANHDLTTRRNGTGIASNRSDTLAVGNNLFYQNGPNNSAASNATGVFLGFNPAALTATPDALGNLVGNPDFAMPQDPRPNGDTPANFFNYGDFDLTSRSVAINAANEALAPPSDILYRTPVAIAGHGFPGTGPASIGAYYFGGVTGASGGTGIISTGGGTGTGTGTTGTGSTGGGGSTTTQSPSVAAESLGGGAAAGVSSPIGGGLALGTRQFSVVTTSLSGNGTVEAAGSAGGLTTEPGPSYIDVDFSDNIQPSSLKPSDLVLSGTGLDPADPAHATSLAWIDDHAVRFFLAGGYSKQGTVSVTIPQGAITDTSGAALAKFADAFQVGPVATPTQLPPAAVPVAPATATAPVSPTAVLASSIPVAPSLAATTPVTQPVAAAPPVAAPGQKLTAKELKQQQAAEAKAAKAHKAAEAAQAKAHKAAQAKAAKEAKAAAKAHKAK